MGPLFRDYKQKGDDKMDLSTQIEGDLIALLDDWFSLPETWDNELDSQIAQWYANPPQVWPKRDYLYFSPSALGACPRELYIKAKYGNKVKDKRRNQPHQGRWQKLGTLGGDLIQRELLAIERNYERLTGNKPRFKFVRNSDGTPMFEEFAKTNKLVEQDGEKFYLYGAPDGIMEYVTDDGEIVRVGLEIKSKQTTPAQTSMHTMRAPDQSHARQIVAYAHMFDVDYYVILYVKYAKQGWCMTDEESEQTPGSRAFCARVTDERKREVFSKAGEGARAVRDNEPPKLALDGRTCDSFKEACAMDVSEAEVEEWRDQFERAKYSSLPQWRINSLVRAFEEIEELRGGEN